MFSEGKPASSTGPTVFILTLSKPGVLRTTLVAHGVLLNNTYGTHAGPKDRLYLFFCCGLFTSLLGVLTAYCILYLCSHP